MLNTFSNQEINLLISHLSNEDAISTQHTSFDGDNSKEPDQNLIYKRLEEGIVSLSDSEVSFSLHGYYVTNLEVPLDDKTVELSIWLKIGIEFKYFRDIDEIDYEHYKVYPIDEHNDVKDNLAPFHSLPYLHCISLNGFWVSEDGYTLSNSTSDLIKEYYQGVIDNLSRGFYIPYREESQDYVEKFYSNYVA
ncbi:TPA: hypothetical protein ACGIK9_003282 [Acinetobacter baumannii]|uniref:hypothetical protein n=1 Tax=Acinetobacter baumannii TaxID=470 RepID=UPI00338ED6EC